MKRTRCGWSWLMVLAVTVWSMGVWAQVAPEGVTDPSLFTVEELPDGSGVAITGFSNPNQLTDIRIPADINGKQVVKLGSWALRNHEELRSVMLPDAVKEIEGRAFSGCAGLESFVVSGNNPAFSSDHGVLFTKDKTRLVLYPAGSKATHYEAPTSVRIIGDYAFSDCSGLTSIVLPDSVTVIGFGAFSGCSGLTSVILPDSVTVIGESAFSYCSGLTSIDLPAFLITIEQDAFYGCSSLKKVVLPDSVRALKYESFCNCTSLSEVTLPRLLMSCDWGVFDGTQVSHLDLPVSSVIISHGGNPTFEYVESLRSLTVHTLPEAILDDDGAHNVIAPHITSFHVPRPYVAEWKRWYPDRTVIPYDDVTWAGEFEFSAVEGGLRLDRFTGSSEHILLPKDVEGKTIVEIGDNAFRNSKIRSLVLPEGVRSIGDWAFDNCQRLETVTLPASLQSIGMGGFAKCHRLVKVVLPEQVRSLGEKVFARCTGLREVRLPQNLVCLFSDAFEECRILMSITMTGGSGKRYAVANGVLFDASMKKLVKYPAGLSASDYVVPQTVERIADYAFENARALRRVTLSPVLRVLGKGAFRKCYGLESIIVPATVKSLGEDAFGNCTSLTSMSFKGSASSFANLNQVIPDWVETLKVAPQYRDGWQQAFPDRDVRLLDGSQAASYEIQVEGPNAVHARDAAFYAATVAVNGIPVPGAKVRWELEGDGGTCTLSQSGRLSVGDVRASGDVRVRATYERPDGTMVSGCQAVRVLSGENSVYRPLELTAGWNLVAPTFELDEASVAALRSMHPFGYSRKSGGYYLVKDFRPGEAFWIFSFRDMTITQSGMGQN